MEECRRRKLTTLIISLLDVLLLSLGHACNSRVLLLFACSIFLAVVILSPKGEFLPLMLFYLPWSPVLKTAPEDYTFFTFVVPAVFIIVLLKAFKKERKYRIEYIGLPLVFFAYTVFIKLLNNLPIEFPYLFFMMMVFFIPIYVSNYKEHMSFERSILFLTAGILSACLAALVLMRYPHMLKYIDIYQWKKIGLIRLSGFYGDSNYYAAQILVAIAGLLIIPGRTKSKAVILLQITAIIALLYFGFQSVSKMFILCTAGIALLWGLNLFIEKQSISYKLAMTAAAAVIIVIVIASSIFRDIIELYLIRFGMVTDASSFTTGRVILVGVYLNYLLSNVNKLFFGIGLSQDQVQVLLNTNNAHNTVIEMIYQIGIIGCLILFLWWRGIYRELAGKTRMELSKKVYFFIMSASVILPWMALDMLYFDEFFYFTLLLFLSKKYLSQKAGDNHDDKKD